MLTQLSLDISEEVWEGEGREEEKDEEQVKRRMKSKDRVASGRGDRA